MGDLKDEIYDPFADDQPGEEGDPTGFGLNDIGNGERLVHEYGKIIRYCSRAGHAPDCISREGL